KLPGGLGARFERLGPQLKESIKAFWAPGLFWEELDWAYMGVVDGHDVPHLREALREALAADRPVVVHIATVKGKGFAPAEAGGGRRGGGRRGRGRARAPGGAGGAPPPPSRSRRSTRRCSATRSCASASATSGSSASPRR